MSAIIGKIRPSYQAQKVGHPTRNDLPNMNLKIELYFTFKYFDNSIVITVAL